ncbi:hypothetical protein Pan216_50710 [Planctomycetes bacterium Pan216]|uniref:Uncharacterized protein n=1 Tax=Kolteria novifilia TaxID=2527975 RepID=A0A518BB20_9BACT|nr:hypothetical protein Pan216_50710 [Planctomycetes bacterium Pan216]
MPVKVRGGKLRWKGKRANHGRKPAISLPHKGIRKSNK